MSDTFTTNYDSCNFYYGEDGKESIKASSGSLAISKETAQNILKVFDNSIIEYENDNMNTFESNKARTYLYNILAETRQEILDILGVPDDIRDDLVYVYEDSGFYDIHNNKIYTF